MDFGCFNILCVTVPLVITLVVVYFFHVELRDKLHAIEKLVCHCKVEAAPKLKGKEPPKPKEDAAPDHAKPNEEAKPKDDGDNVMPKDSAKDSLPKDSVDIHDRWAPEEMPEIVMISSDISRGLLDSMAPMFSLSVDEPPPSTSVRRRRKGKASAAVVIEDADVSLAPEMSSVTADEAASVAA